MKKIIATVSLLIVLLPFGLVNAEEDKFIETVTFGIPTFTMKNYDNLTTNMVVGGMILNSRDHFVDNHDNFTEHGVVYRGYHALSDIYGNTEDIFTYVLYLSPDTIKKIDFSNWNPDTQTFMEVADGSYLHDAFKETDYYSFQKKDNDLPQSFTGVIDGTRVNENTMGIDPKDVPDLSNAATKSKSVDKVYGKIDESGKRLINENPTYLIETDKTKTSFLLTNGEIFIVSIDYKDMLPYTDSNLLMLLDEASRYMEEDAQMIEDISEQDYVQYLYESQDTGLRYRVEIGSFENELYGIYISQE